MILRRKISLFILIVVGYFCSLQAAIPDGYYSSAEGKRKAELKTALHNIIRNHTFLDFDASTSIWWYTYFKATDWNPNGYFWDMYSNNQRPNNSGGLMNREHCMPRSWWGSSSNYSTFDANGDLVNLQPSDAAANEQKSNLPLGEVGTATYTNGVVKVGNNIFPGFYGTVFEPADEYKGDFARTYMYMVTCYEDYSTYWHETGTLTMLNGGTYPVFKSWAINLLLKWNAGDPVSTKELNRNDSVYSIQHNRNPFIDHPELADFIWGTRMSEIWTSDVGPAEIPIIFTVQPNPVSSALTVNINNPEKATYYIVSLDGIVLKTGKFGTDGTISVDDINNGMYLLKVYTTTKRMVAKFIVLH